MFDGEPLVVTAFAIQQRLPSTRVRFVAAVNGVSCFVKTFGDAVVMCTADELKRVVGLPALGVSRAVVPPHGPVLVARYFPEHRRLRDIADPAEVDPEALLRILWFDVWIRNNDRTGSNIIDCSAGLVPIDESAAFTRPSTFRLSPRWYDAIGDRWRTWRCPSWPPDPRAVTDTCRRAGDARGSAWAWELIDRVERMPVLWAAYVVGAEARRSKRSPELILDK